MKLHFITAQNTAVESGSWFRFALALLVLIGGCHLTLAQNSETRPVARLVTELSAAENRPRHAKSSRAAINSSIVTTPSLEEATPIERKAFEQTNLARTKEGLPPLNWDAALCRMARMHSENMARAGYFTHLSPEGSRLRERAQSVGIARYSVLGENIAYNLGYDDPGGFAVERWMLSPKHRANILYTEFKSMAVGTFVAADGSVYLTQTFIAR
jgi:uncharacterized protein YkwD